MTIGVEDFVHAHEWLTEAESFMPDIFKAGAVNSDANAMQEIRHFVLAHDVGWGVSGQKIERFARDLLPLPTLWRVIEAMVRTGDLYLIGKDEASGSKFYAGEPLLPRQTKINNSSEPEAEPTDVKQ